MNFKRSNICFSETFRNIGNVNTVTAGNVIMENVLIRNGYVMENISVNSTTSMIPMIQTRLKDANFIQVHMINLDNRILSNYDSVQVLRI